MQGGDEEHQFHLKNKGEDWLSSMPDDVLLNIAERLGIADAMRISFLSRRWRQIPAMLSKIHITADPCDGAARANAAVLRATKSLLQSRTTGPRTIRLLSVQFFLGHTSTSIKIGKAVADCLSGAQG